MLLVQVKRDLMDVDGFAYWVCDKTMELLAEKRYDEEAFEAACDEAAFEMERDVIQAWDYEEGQEVSHLIEIDNYNLIREFMPTLEIYNDWLEM